MDKPQHVSFEVLSRDRSNPRDLRRCSLATEVIRVQDVKNVRRFHLSAEDRQFLGGEFSSVYVDRGRGKEDPMMIVKGSVKDVCGMLGIPLPSDGKA